MSSPLWSTHTVVLGAGSVAKRFRAEAREGSRREWRALTLLDRYAPGLAPEPWAADLAAGEPTVVMSRLTGAPLRGLLLSDDQVEALVAAVTRMHEAVPPDVLEKIVARIPVKRLGKADEIARAVLFLVADDGGFITGSTLSINGGQHMY